MIRSALALGFVLALGAGAATAQTAPAPAPAAPVAAAADALDGKALYRTKTCIACHGREGTKGIQTFPELAGQDAIRQIGTLAAASALGSLEACLGSPGCKLAVFLHLPFWSVCSAEVAGLSQFALRDLLESLRQWWSVEGSGVALPEHTEWLPPVNR